MFNKKTINNPEIGMVVSENGISVAATGAQKSSIESEHFSNDDWVGVKSWVNKHKLASKQVHLVLDSKQYQLYQVEPPKVPENEINAALLYSLRDRLEYKVEEAQIDHFSFPEDAQRGSVKKVNVVTTHRPTLKRCIAGIEQAGLHINKIDIAELALRNLILEKQSMAKGACILAYRESSVTFMIYRNAELYLTRTVAVNSWQDCISLENTHSREGLLLEIQRTLDYYQSQLGQPPVSELFIPDWSKPLSPLIDYLSENLSIEVTKISLRKDNQETAENDELRQLMLATAAVSNNSEKEEKDSAKG